MTAIRVLIADDENVIREGISMMLEPHSDVEVVGTVGDGLEALAEIARLDPDVLLLDVRMPRLDGLGVLRRLAGSERPRVVVLTTFDVDDYIAEALRAGAVGFLLKSSSHEDIVAAVRAAAQGRNALGHQVFDRVVDSFLREVGTASDEISAVLDSLTRREAEVLSLLGEGLTNAEIASRLVLSLHTVKTHVSRILLKTGTGSRGHAAAFARNHRRALDRLIVDRPR